MTKKSLSEQNSSPKQGSLSKQSITETKQEMTTSAPQQIATKTTKAERNILIAFLLNLGFSVYEFIGGAFTNSAAIMSDAVHDLGDAMSIGISYILERKSKKQPDEKYTYGYVRFSLVGGMITTFILLLGSVFVIYNAIDHIINPVVINYDGMIILAVIGAIVNFIATYVTHEGNSLNQKSVNLHMLEDVLGWIVVLIGAIVMRFTDFAIIDPILSILVALFILKHAWDTFHEIITIFLEKTPNNISLDQLKQHILAIKDVKDVHHIHIWTMDGYHNYATMHIVTTNSRVKAAVKAELKEHSIDHATIEIESPDEVCSEENCHPEIGKAVSTHRHHH